MRVTYHVRTLAIFRRAMSDCVALLVLHAALLVTLLLALLATARATRRRRRGYPDLAVARGERSVTGLFVLYGGATVVFSLAVQVAAAAEGHKVGLIVVDYVVLSYLFFFNTWFRNQIVFRVLARIATD
jgi:ABC-type sugar transport system substrate-binding protein